MQANCAISKLKDIENLRTAIAAKKSTFTTEKINEIIETYKDQWRSLFYTPNKDRDLVLNAKPFKKHLTNLVSKIENNESVEYIDTKFSYTSHKLYYTKDGSIKMATVSPSERFLLVKIDKNSNEDIVPDVKQLTEINFVNFCSKTLKSVEIDSILSKHLNGLKLNKFKIENLLHTF